MKMTFAMGHTREEESHQSLNNKEGKNMDDIKQRLARHLVLDRPPFQRTGLHGQVIDSSQYITASEASKCARKLYHDKHGSKIDPNSMTEEDLNELLLDGGTPGHGYMERGHIIEHWITDTLMHQLYDDEDLVCTGRSQVTLTKGHVCGTPDGQYIRHKQGFRTQEYKTAGEDVFDANPAHIMQLGINVVLTEHNRPTLEAKYNTTFGKALGGDLTYINASNVLNIKQYHITMQQAVAAFDKAQTKADYVFGTPLSDIPFEGVKTGECKDCPYKKFCTAELENRDDEFSKLAREHMTRRVSIAEFQDFTDPKVVKECAEHLIGYLRARTRRLEQEKLENSYKPKAISLLEYNKEHHGEIPLITVDNTKVQVKLSKPVERSTFDQKRAAADGVDVAKYLTPSPPYYMVLVKEVQED